MLLKNNKITSKRDVCDRKKQEVEVWYLVKIVFDRMCMPNFLIILPVMVVQKQMITQINAPATNRCQICGCTILDKIFSKKCDILCQW